LDAQQKPATYEPCVGIEPAIFKELLLEFQFPCRKRVSVNSFKVRFHGHSSGASKSTPLELLCKANITTEAEERFRMLAVPWKLHFNATAYGI
jgi:hypothetical protein